jgi:AraC-like DNA-binding protein
MQIPPIPRLSHLVRHFLILEGPGLDKAIHRLIPDGNPGIVFHYGAPFHAFPANFAYGQVTRPHTIVSGGPMGAFIVVLHPQALSQLTGLPAHTLTNTFLPLQQLWGAKADTLHNQLIRAASHQQRLDCVQSFLLQYTPQPPNRIITYSLQWMEYQETPQMEELAGRLSIGIRTLERVFKTVIGISPKQFAGIIRTRHFLKALKQTDTENITGLAYQFGYYDQSHLIKDFKKKTGITPGNYFTAKDTLALNFIQFPA